MPVKVSGFPGKQAAHLCCEQVQLPRLLVVADAVAGHRGARLVAAWLAAWLGPDRHR
jgi:hypothetical protein